jgi:hypothetical protein
MNSFVRLFVPKNYYRLTILQVNRLSWHCEAAFTEAGLMSGVDFETLTSPKDLFSRRLVPNSIIRNYRCKLLQVHFSDQ